MQHDRFKELLEELDGNSVSTLAEKNARYSSSDDALHNFKSGADIMGGTPAQACWGYMTKHLTALRDMVERDDFSNREDFLEKCQDTINYIRFLWCIGNETVEETQGSTENDMPCKKRIDIYHKSSGELVKTIQGIYVEVKVFDDCFTVTNGYDDTRRIYTFSDFYGVEHTLLDGDYVWVRKIEK